MIAEVSIRCQKTPEVGIRRIPAYTPQYTTAYSHVLCKKGTYVTQGAKMKIRFLAECRNMRIKDEMLVDNNTKVVIYQWLTGEQAVLKLGTVVKDSRR